jgi:hypothetical protein
MGIIWKEGRAFGQVSGLQAGNQSRIIQLALHLTF